MRVRRLAVPALVLVALWVVAGAVLSVLFRGGWIRNTVLLVISPLWFIAVYLMLVLLLPVALWLHRRFDTIVLVVLAGAAGAVDILRFRQGYGWLGALNMVIVWGLCHQLGFFYERIVAARRTVDWTLLLGGLFALGGLVGSGLYPGSMVGVPGELSNMAPPTLCIVALVLFQAGAAEILRPSIEVRLARPRWSAVNDVINRFALPLFLFHTTGMALSRAVNYALAGETNEATSPTIGWWLYRPLAFVGPLVFTLPVIWIFGRTMGPPPHPSDGLTPSPEAFTAPEAFRPGRGAPNPRTSQLGVTSPLTTWMKPLLASMSGVSIVTSPTVCGGPVDVEAGAAQRLHRRLVEQLAPR